MDKPNFKPGDPPPEGFVAWHEWAEVQHQAGLRQTKCRNCHRFFYPSENHDSKTCLNTFTD